MFDIEERSAADKRGSYSVPTAVFPKSKRQNEVPERQDTGSQASVGYWDRGLEDPVAYA
jgi:hypothetical protein